MKQFLIKSIEKTHLIIFNKPISDRMRQFLVNLSWSFSSGLAVMFITMLIGTLAGRIMGPEEFGKYNLVVLISSYVILFAFFGLDISTVKAIVKSKDEYQKKSVFFSSFVFVISMLVILSVAGLIFGPDMIVKFAFEQKIILFAILYTFGTSIKSILDLLVRALEKFKMQAIGKIIEVMAMLIVFIGIYALLKRMNYQTYTLMIVAGIISVSLYYLFFLKDYFRGFSLERLKTQLSDGKFFMLSALLATFFISADRLLIAKYIDLKTLGIYSAYYSGSFALVRTFAMLFTNVLLPASAKEKDKAFTLKLDQLMFKGFIPLFLVVALALVVVLSLFGKAYPLRADYLLLFSLVSTLFFFQSLFDIIILDAPRKQYVQYICISNFINLLTVVFYYLVLKTGAKSINLILIGFALNIILSILVQRIFIKSMRRS